MVRAPFELIEPTGSETPVIVEIPHAGLDLPPPFLETVVAPARALARDADLYVDALYQDATLEGATVLVAYASRYLIDVNRAEADVDGEVVEGGRLDVLLQHGLIWRTTSDGERALARKLRRAEVEERLDLVWRPYHRALSAAVERKLERFGIAVILAAHSMPSVERAPGRELRSGPVRADVVPGTRGRIQRRCALHRRGRGARGRVSLDGAARRPPCGRLHDAALRAPERAGPRGSGRAFEAALRRRGHPSALTSVSRAFGGGAVG